MQRRLLRKSKKVVKEPDHQFLYHLCKIFRKEPDDTFFEEMDPIKKQWLYESWINEIEQDLEKTRMLGILIGSFTNPEAANKMLKRERPDYASTDDDFQKSISMVDNAPMPKPKAKTKRRRRKIVR